MKKKNFFLTQENLDYLEQVRIRQNYPNISQAIRTIIDQHQLYLSKT